MILQVDGDKQVVVQPLIIGIQLRLTVRQVTLGLGRMHIYITVVIMEVLMVNLTQMVMEVFTVLVLLTLELNKVLIL